MLATCLSCAPRPVAGNTVCRLVAVARALFSSVASLIPRVYSSFDAWTTERPLSKLSRLCSPDSFDGKPPIPCRPSVTFGGTVVGTVCWPEQNSPQPPMETTIGYADGG